MIPWIHRQARQLAAMPGQMAYLPRGLKMVWSAARAWNIAIGNLAAKPASIDIEEAARGAGAHETIARLPLGYDALLGKSFANGTDLTAGEWQPHRFTIAMRADLIHVMDQGRVVESGTLESLLNNAGFYAGSWREQTHARAAHADEAA